MLTMGLDDYSICYLNDDGSYVNAYRAQWWAPSFRDYGSYLIPSVFFGGEFLPWIPASSSIGE